MSAKPGTLKVPRLLGAVVVLIRQVTAEEAKQLGMDVDNINGPPYLVGLDNGVKLVAAADPEMNEFGHMLGLLNGKAFDISERDSR